MAVLGDGLGGLSLDLVMGFEVNYQSVERRRALIHGLPPISCFSH